MRKKCDGKKFRMNINSSSAAKGKIRYKYDDMVYFF